MWELQIWTCQNRLSAAMRTPSTELASITALSPGAPVVHAP